MNQKSASDMKFFSNSYIKRQTAWVMLALWLLALASGVANACLLDSHEPAHHGAAVAESLEKADAPIDPHTRRAVATSHDEDTDASRVPCLKVCDDGSQALQKKYTASDLTDRGPASLVATLWGVAPPALPAIRLTDELAPLRAGPFLRIRYSRWAL